MDKDDPTRKVYNCNIYDIIEKEVEVDSAVMERWRRPGYQRAFRDIELVDLSAKPGCLEFHIKAGLDRTPVIAPFMMVIIFTFVICNVYLVSHIR